MKEEVIYKPLPGLENYYKIGNDGSVIRIKGNITIANYLEFRANQKGVVSRARTIKICHNKKFYNIPLARTVALLFVPNDNPEENKFIDYIDGNRDNCKASNIKWVKHKICKPKDNLSSKIKFRIDKNNKLKWIL